MPWSRPWVLLAVAAVALVPACGGGGGGETSPSTSSTAGRSTTPSVVGPAGPPAPSTTVAEGPARSPTPAPWRAPTRNVVALIRKAGLTPLDRERFEYHIHDHLDVFVDGVAQTVAGGIGIDLDAGRISPLHTHEPNGVIHVENLEPIDLTLRQFFIEWDVDTSPGCIGGYCRPQTTVAVYVNGLNRGADVAQIDIVGGQEIAVVIGKAPPQIPKSYDFSAVGGSMR